MYHVFMLTTWEVGTVICISCTFLSFECYFKRLKLCLHFQCNPKWTCSAIWSRYILLVAKIVREGSFLLLYKFKNDVCFCCYKSVSLDKNNDKLGAQLHVIYSVLSMYTPFCANNVTSDYMWNKNWNQILSFMYCTINNYVIYSIFSWPTLYLRAV